METYSKNMASLFNGFRIDNCHSTPIHVAKYLLDCARKVNPNLYVVAELFTGSEEKDMKFVCELGINSLIRESMSAWDNQEFSRIIHKYGGRPVGSFMMDANSASPTWLYENNDAVILHRGSVPHALLMECTHDNETPIQRRTLYNFLSNSASSCMSTCAFGSVKGYDEVYPDLLDIVNETRMYDGKDIYQGISDIKKILVRLHVSMAQNNFGEIHVDQRGEVLSVTRYNPISHEGFLLISHMGFQKTIVFDFETVLSEVDMEIVFQASVQPLDDICPRSDNDTLRGIPCSANFGSSTNNYSISSLVLERKTLLHFKKLDPGEIYLFKFRPTRSARDSIMNLENDLKFNYMTANAVLLDSERIMDGTADLSFSIDELNCLLFKTEPEEIDSTHGDSVYEIPGFGKLAYAGFAGWAFPIRNIVSENNLGHALCHHLRDGKWPVQFIKHRLEKYDYSDFLAIVAY